MAYNDLPDEDAFSIPPPARAEKSQAPALRAMLEELAASDSPHLPESVTPGQLIATLKTQTWQRRVATARFLGASGEPEAVAALRELVAHDEFSSVRASAARALGRQRLQAAELLFLSALQQDIAHEVRTAAADALASLGPLLSAPAVETLVESFYAEVHEATRAAVLAALGSLGRRAPMATLKFALADPAWEVREAAALAMGEQGTHADEAAPEALLDDEAASVCTAAVYAPGQIGDETAPSLSATPGTLAGPPGAGRETLWALAQKNTADEHVRLRTSGGINFYAYESGELSGTRVIAQALDNQWVPQRLISAIFQGKISSNNAEKYLIPMCYLWDNRETGSRME
ncbi:MAG TPA: HEAT repeat domain-containing protein [Ktedonobacteraceae bacterium]|jgi:hypothetical protein